MIFRVYIKIYIHTYIHTCIVLDFIVMQTSKVNRERGIGEKEEEPALIMVS